MLFQRYTGQHKDRDGMNWLKQASYILGKFWTVVFQTSDMVDGIRHIISVCGKTCQERADRLLGREVANDKRLYRVNLPFVVYILKTRVERDGDTVSEVDCIGHPAASVAAILNGNANIGAVDAHGGWLAELRDPIPEPLFLSDHITSYSKTLFLHADYDMSDGNILFYADPATLGLPEVGFVDDKGMLRTYYKLYGWRRPEPARKDMVCAFESPSLNPYADIVWDIHQRGATHYNVKKLMGAVTDSVIAEEDGVVDHSWTEQDYNCITVNGKVYSSKLAPNILHGYNVKAGDVLFGTLRMYSGTDDIPQSIPGIRIMTDAGELVAPNETLAAVTVDAVNTIPLSGGNDTLMAYRAKCVELAHDINCPDIDVPAELNPMTFIMQTLRRGRAVFVSLIAGDLEPLSAALECIRRNACAAGMITVHISAESDTVNVSSSFTAEAGHGAVAVDATVTIQEMAAAAEISI